MILLLLAPSLPTQKRWRATPSKAAGATMREYTGSTLGGTRHGSGKCTFRNKGFAYDGEWKDGLMEGRGTLTLAGVFSFCAGLQRELLL